MFEVIEQIPLTDHGEQGQFHFVECKRQELFRSGGFDKAERLKDRPGDPDEDLRGRVFEERRIVFDQRPALSAENAAVHDIEAVFLFVFASADGTAVQIGHELRTEILRRITSLSFSTA